MTIKTAGLTICAFVAMVCAGWAQNSTPQKFHTSTPHPHHPSQEVGAPKKHSSGPPVVSPKTQSARQSEVDRLEKQNSMHLQAQARQHTSTRTTQVSKVHPQPASHSDNINFSYHPPHTQSAGAGAHKH